MNTSIVQGHHDLLLPVVAWISILFIRQVLKRIERIKPQSWRYRKAALILVAVLDLLLVFIVVIWLGDYYLGQYQGGRFILVAGTVLFLLGYGWFIFADTTAGFVFRLDNTFRPGGTIIFEGKEGKVHHVGIRNLIIARIDGVQLKIPYRYLAGRPLEIPLSRRDEGLHTFLLPAVDLEAEKQIIERLRVLILNSPLVTTLREPVIRPVSSTDGKPQIQVAVHLMDPVYSFQFESTIRSAWLAIATDKDEESAENIAGRL